jgi:hypothetical protein
MTSGGFSLGAWDYLRWKHVVPISNNKGEIIAAKVIITLKKRRKKSNYSFSYYYKTL